MESEAEAASEAYYEKKMDEPALDDSGPDESDIAEAAEDHGISVYADLEFVNRQVTGLAIAGLYHLWERMLKEFLVREFSNYDPPYISPGEVRSAVFVKLVKLLTGIGWDVMNANFHTDLDHLHLVANVIKHGDGESCNKLMRKAPWMFHEFLHPLLHNGRKAEHLELTKEDFLRFTVAVREFFQQFPERLNYEPRQS